MVSIDPGAASPAPTALLGVSASWVIWSVLAGMVVGVIYTASPLTVWVVVAAVALLRYGTHGLPTCERSWLIGILLLAFALRILAVSALFLGSPHDDQAAGILFGDEAYALERSWRMRDVLLGFPLSTYDYVIAFDEYGRSSYLSVMTFVQWLVGPSPYGLRLLNTVFFIGAVLLLFHSARRSFGATVAFGGLCVILFLPTLFFWSISLLKESLYFILTVIVLVAAIAAARSATWLGRAGLGLIVAAALWALQDLRAWSVTLASGGLLLGLACRFVTMRAWRVWTAMGLALAAVAVLASRPAAQQVVLPWIDVAATAHAGHVFTIGHSYKLLDEEFYVRPTALPSFRLTPDEAARFVVRALISYLVVPVPWHIATTGELVYLPEQMAWYLLLLFACFGIVAAFRRDPLVTCLLVGYMAPTAAAVAMTTGNVGTLIRHRTLVVPYLVWISAAGFCAVLRRLIPPCARL